MQEQVPRIANMATSSGPQKSDLLLDMHISSELPHKQAQFGTVVPRAQSQISPKATQTPQQEGLAGSPRNSSSSSC